MNFKVIDKGKEINCNIIHLFRDDNNDINYIIYTDGTKDKNDDLEIYASRYIKENDSFILKSIENEYEWNLIDNVLDTLKMEM